jgi:hypothetical protein
MKYKRLALLGLSAALVVSLVLATRLARADVFFNQDIPISFVDFSPCTGELISFSGTIHVVERETVDGSGGIQIGIHENYQGVTGVGLTTGTVYHAPGVLNQQLNFTNGATTQTFTEDVRYIAPGRDNNLLVHYNQHITINPDGTVTAFVDNVRITCQ